MSRLTCTDCIHDYVCHNLNNLNYWNKDDPNGDPMDKFCLCFKNKELFIELPCKLGDTVYDVVLCVDGKYNIKEMVVKAVRPYGAIRWVKGKDPKLWNVYLEGNYEYAYRHFYDFGRTVFLTKAEAEEALKRMQDNE